jgi:hypothetical protein
MSDAPMIEERLRRFRVDADDADWEDVLRRAEMAPKRVPALFSRRRMVLALAACIAIAAPAIVFSGLLNSSHKPAASTGPASSGCVPLRSRLQATTRNGQSVVEAVGALTGQTKAQELTIYREMRLTRVRTLSGKTLPANLSGWLQTSPHPAAFAADAPGLWALDGGLIAILTPERLAHTPVGPLLSIAPLVHGDVTLSSAACWADPSLPTSAFTGPLHEVPGSNAYTLAQRAGGFYAYPLSQLLRLLHSH